jgi:hypothetical protein
MEEIEGYKKGTDEEEKRIIFTDNLHRHTKLTIVLKYYKVTQSKFFRRIISAVLNEEPAVMSYLEELSPRSIKRKQKAERLKTKGEKALDDLGMSERERDHIFDILESEFPDL